MPSDSFKQPTSQGGNADPDVPESQLEFLKAPRCELQAILDSNHGNNIRRILRSLTELRYSPALTLELMQLVLSVARLILRIPGTGVSIPSTFVLDTANVQLEWDVQNPHCPFKEYRSLETHFCRGIDVKKVAISQALLRLCFPGPGLIPIVGIWQANQGFNARTFLVEAPITGSVELGNYLAWNPDVDRRLLLRDIINAVEWLHANGVVLGLVAHQSVAIAPTGRAYLCNLDYIRLEDSATPFTPMIASLDLFRRVAPEIVQPLMGAREGHLATLNKASDVYSLGYFLFTDQKPFPQYTKHPLHICPPMAAVAEGQQFQKPADVDARRHGLTESTWAVIQHCCARNPVDRPPVSNILVDPRPKD